MNEPEPCDYARRRPAAVPGGESLLLSLVSAGLFLYVGYGLGLVGISGNAIYDGSVTALVWGSRVVGFGILATVAMGYLRVPGVALLNFILAALATLGCLGIGAIWLINSDTEGVLLLLFGLLNASAAKGAWLRWQYERRPLRQGEQPEQDD